MVHIKFLWNYAGNCLINQHSDINRTKKILADESLCDTIVVVDNFMTSSAMYADFLLPAVTNLEESDFAVQTMNSASEMAYVIFSKHLFDLSLLWELPPGDYIPALPEYVPEREGIGDPAQEKYPLQMITHHYKQRTHSTYGNVDWLQKVAPQQIWINPLNAEIRGIRHHDWVVVENDRGRCIVRAKVTPRIMPGVVSLPQGAWYRPDSDGIDRGGSANTLTFMKPTPLAKGNPQHSNLVEVRKYE